jgi:ABC-2 type transport system ATP-binding protein
MPGYVYGLLGKNGAGKTSLLKIMAGLLIPKSGKSTLNNIETCKRFPEILEDIYLVPEEFSLSPVNMNDYISLYGSFYRKFDNNIMLQLIDEFELPKNHKLSSFSYGQKKKFLIAFGIATNSDFLLFDEPTNGLDIPSKGQFRRIIAKYLTEKRCFVISTHQVRDLENILDTIVIIDDGKIIFNYNIDIISKKLAFISLNQNYNVSDILYFEDLPLGKNAIVKNDKNLDTKIDLELLFNGVLSKYNLFNEILK